MEKETFFESRQLASFETFSSGFARETKFEFLNIKGEKKDVRWCQKTFLPFSTSKDYWHRHSVFINFLPFSLPKVWYFSSSQCILHYTEWIFQKLRKNTYVLESKTKLPSAAKDSFWTFDCNPLRESVVSLHAECMLGIVPVFHSNFCHSLCSWSKDTELKTLWHAIEKTLFWEFFSFCVSTHCMLQMCFWRKMSPYNVYTGCGIAKEKRNLHTTWQSGTWMLCPSFWTQERNTPNLKLSPLLLKLWTHACDSFPCKVNHFNFAHYVDTCVEFVLQLTCHYMYVCANALGMFFVFQNAIFNAVTFSTNQLLPNDTKHAAKNGSRNEGFSVAQLVKKLSCLKRNIRELSWCYYGLVKPKVITSFSVFL